MEHRYVVDQELATHQGAQLAKLVCWYQPSEVLKLATADNIELLALSGLRGPDQGKLVVVEEADLLLVDGNLLTDIKLIEDPTKNSLLFMKDGRVYKTLALIRGQPQSEVRSTRQLHQQRAKEVWTGSPGCMLVGILPWGCTKIAFEPYITTRAP